MTSVLKTSIKSEKYNIVKVEWLLSSLSEKNAKDRLVLRPTDMIFANNDLKETFSEKYDRFGDTWAKDITESDLDNLMVNIPNKVFLNINLT